jgi:hypothetical protein
MAAGEVVVNRQTLAVALGTLAVVLIGGFLMYASPTPEGARQPPPAANAVKAEKGKRVGESSHRHLNESKLVHEVAVPADRPAAPKDAPNVVVVFASTQRRDQWSVYGGPPDHHAVPGAAGGRGRQVHRRAVGVGGAAHGGRSADHRAVPPPGGPRGAG